MFRFCQRVRLLGLCGGGCWDRGDHLANVQNRAVRRQLDTAGGGAVVFGAHRCFGGGVPLAGAGGFAVDVDSAAGSCDAVVPVQVGELLQGKGGVPFVHNSTLLLTIFHGSFLGGHCSPF